MTCSPAKLEANRRNSARSTGPRTEEGKAVSRANALKHGMTGNGIVVLEDDLARIAAVARNLRDEHQPTTEVGQAMADRAAMLLVRLDRSGLFELAMVHDQVAAAVYDFDQARRDWADELFDELDANPGALFELERFPEGIDRLIEAWREIDTIDEWSADDLARIAVLSVAGGEELTVDRTSIPVLIERLETARAAIDRRPIERARRQAAELALFSDSPAAILARRYEAATERAFYKAIKTMIESEAPKPVFPSPELPQTSASGYPVGSLLSVPILPPLRKLVTEATVAPVDPKPPVDRAKRPDPKKLREAQRRKRR